MKPQKLGRWSEFVVLVLVQLWLWSWRLDAEYFVAHDTVRVFDVLHLTYSQLVLHGDLARWLPYGNYGTPIDAWASVTLSPSMYLAMLIGWASGLHDALVVLKLGVLFEEFCFLAGLFVLCSLILKGRASVVFVCVGAIAVVNPYSQIWWNFRLFYLVPACLAALVLFFERRNVLYLWSTGLLTVTALVGNRPYFAPLYLYLSAAFALPYTLRGPSIWLLLLRKSRANLLGAAAFVLGAGTYLWSQLEAYSPVTMQGPGADAVERSRGLTDFLTRGTGPDVIATAQQLVLGWPIFATWRESPDISLYIGLLPWFLMPWALLAPRKPPALTGMLAAAALLAWLSLGGLGARLLYALPGMELLRHVGFVHPLTLQLLLIVAGFGFDAFIERGRIWHLLLLSTLALLAVDAFGRQYLARIAMNGVIDVSPLLLFVARGLVYVSIAALCFLVLAIRHRPSGWRARPISSAEWVGLALLCAFTLDVLSYRRMSDYVVRAVPAELTYAMATTLVAPLDFRRRRTREYPPGRASQAAALVDWTRSSTGSARHGTAPTAPAFLRHDPCETSVASGWSPEVRALLRARPRGAEDSELMIVLGCAADKLRIVRDAVLVKTTDAALPLVAAADRLADRVVLVDGQAPTEPAASAAPASDRSAVRLRMFDANRLALDASVDGVGPAWLVYADAYAVDWRATVDSRPVPILSAYAAFKAVRIPAGHHRVELKYERPLWRDPVLLMALLGALAQLAMLSLASALRIGDRTQGRAD